MSTTNASASGCRPSLRLIAGGRDPEARPPLLTDADAKSAEHDALAWVADRLGEGAERMPAGSPWRERLIREMRLLRSTAQLPVIPAAR
jgi:hypothetical protein